MHAHLVDESKVNFIVGMFVEADIITDSKQNLALPKEAIIEIEDNYFALVLKKKENGKYYFEKTKLDIGIQTETYVTILNSENIKNKQILIEGGYMLSEINE